MGPVRVLGRIDLAEQVAKRLRNVGVTARVFTGEPMAEAAVATMGQDDTVLDLVIEDFGVCEAIKSSSLEGALPGGGRLHRLVIFMASPGVRLPNGFLPMQLLARGPDAFIHSSASGHEILAACERVQRRNAGLSAALRMFIVPVLVLAEFGATCAADCSNNGAGTPATNTLREGLLAALLALMAVEGWRLGRLSHLARWKRAMPPLMLVVAAWSLFDAGKWLLIWLRR